MQDFFENLMLMLYVHKSKACIELCCTLTYPFYTEARLFLESLAVYSSSSCILRFRCASKTQI